MNAIICIVILAICIFFFITRWIPAWITAILGCLLFSFTGICTVEESFSGFSNNIVLIVFGMMVIGAAMKHTGCADLIGNNLISISRGSERLFLFFGSITAAVLSTFLSNTTVISMFIPVVQSISLSSKTMSEKRLVLPISMAAMFGGVCTLIGSTPQITANGLLKNMSGTELGLFDLSITGLVILIGFMIYIETIGYKISFNLWNIDEVSTGSTDKEPSGHSYDKRKCHILFIIIIVMFALFVFSDISTGAISVTAAIICILTGCIPEKRVFNEIKWQVLFLLAGCLGLAKGISKSGLGDFIEAWALSVLKESFPPIVIFALFIIMTLIVSNFITNSTAVILFLPIALGICNALGLNPKTFTVGIIMAANLSFATPLANAQTAMTMVAGYRFSDYFKYSWLLELIVIGITLTIVPIIYPIV